MTENKQFQQRKKELLNRLELAEIKQLELRLQLAETYIEKLNIYLEESLQNPG
jgi:hypothetical protein